MSKKFGERKQHLIEECSELIQALCKFQRFGWDSWNPYNSEQKTNKEEVLKEIEDVEKRIMEVKLEIKNFESENII